MTFAFAHLESSTSMAKKNLDKHISNQDFIKKPRGKKTSTVPKGPFHFLSSANPVQREKNIQQLLNVSHKIPNVANLFLVSYKQFFNRSHILHVGFFSSLLAMPSLFFYVPLFSPSVPGFFLPLDIHIDLNIYYTKMRTYIYLI